MLGIVDRLGDTRPPPVGLVDGSQLVVFGPAAGSQLDYDVHRTVCALVASLVNDRLIDGVHDVSEGGLVLALTEMAVRSGTGFVVGATELFTESPSRVVVSVPRSNIGEVHRRHRDAGIEATRLGEAGGDRLVVNGFLDVALDDAVATWRDRIPDALGAGTTQG